MGARERARRARRALRFLLALRRLPPRVARFQWRARRHAVRTGDELSLASATRPPKLARLLRAASGRRQVVELGTATAWTTVSLLIAEGGRRVWSFDPLPHPRRDDYLRLAGEDVRRRVQLIDDAGRAARPEARPVEVLYIDSSHERAETIAEVRAWWPHLAPGAVIVFDDYGHPSFPGVQEAVQELALDGEACDGLWIHRRPGSDPEAVEHPA